MNRPSRNLIRYAWLPKAAVLALSVSLAACGGGNDDRKPEPVVVATSQPTAEPTTEPTTEPTMEPTAPPSAKSTISSPTDDEIFVDTDEIVVTAEPGAGSAAVTSAQLWVNGAEVATAAAAPFSWTSKDVTELDALKLGRHEIAVKLIRGSEEEIVKVSLRIDELMYETVVAENYVWDNKPLAIDTDYVSPTTGITYKNMKGVWGNAKVETDVPDTEEDALYYRELSSGDAAKDLNLEIAVPNGTYKLLMHFAEIWHDGTPEKGPGGSDKGVGARVMDVSVEGALIKDDFDILDAAGGYLKPFVETVESVTITDGTLNIDIASSVDQPKINAFALVKIISAWDDDDGDSVPNFEDKCKDTKEADKDNVDAEGCVKVAPAVNLIADLNSDFEGTADTAWKQFWDTPADEFSISDMAGKDGGKGIHLNCKKEKRCGILVSAEDFPQLFGDNKGRRFVMKMDVKINNYDVAGMPRIMRIDMVDDKFWADGVHEQFSPATSSEWTEVSFEFDEKDWAPMRADNNKRARLEGYFLTDVDGVIDAYIDNLRIEEIPK